MSFCDTWRGTGTIPKKGNYDEENKIQKKKKKGKEKEKKKQKKNVWHQEEATRSLCIRKASNYLTSLTVWNKRWEEPSIDHN